MKISFEVTQDDINAATKARDEGVMWVDYRASRDCPIARAVRRQYPEACVGMSAVHLDMSGKRSFPLPPAAERFRRDFDHLQAVQPFSFEGEVP